MSSPTSLYIEPWVLNGGLMGAREENLGWIGSSGKSDSNT